MESLAFAALGAGILSFFSPCVLPVAAGMISIISGLSLKEISSGGKARLKAALYTFCFFCGFALCFSLLGASSGAIGKFVTANTKIIQTVCGIILILVGAYILDLFKLPFLLKTKKFDVSSLRPGYISAFVAGLAFSFAWTPCLGPVLTGLIVMAAAQETALKGAELLFVYSMGLGIPFFLLALLGGLLLDKIKNIRGIIKYSQKIMGILIAAIGIIFLVNINFLMKIAR